MKCPKCNGRCSHPRRESCNHAPYDCWLLGCTELVTCKKCGGVGYLGMNAVRQFLIQIRALSHGDVERLAGQALQAFDVAMPPSVPRSKNKAR